MRKVISVLICIAVLLFVSVSIAEANRSITIKSETNVVFLKKQLKLQAEVTKATADAPEKTQLVWESDHPEIAKVNNGLVAGVSAGKAKITVSAKDDPSITASIEIEVQVPVKTIKPEQARLEMFVGENYKEEAELKVEIQPEDAFYKDVSYSSSNEKVATVDEKGKVTAVGAGNAKITIASNEPGSTAKANVNVVVKQAIDKIVFDEQEIYVAEKQSKTVKPGFEPKSASTKQLEWVSQDESIAKVANNGSITGVSCGTTIITATAKDTGTVKETITVTVIKALKKISVDYPRLTLEPGIDWKQKITITPEDASVKGITWTSSNEKVATVDENGKISPIAPGKCTITGISQDGYNAKVQVPVEVKKHDVVITSPGETKVDFAVKDYQSMAGMQVGNMFWGTIWKTTVTYKNKCVKPADSSDNRLIPIKPGSDIISVVEKENKKISSKKKYTVFVARSAVEEEDKEESSVSTTDTDLNKQNNTESSVADVKEKNGEEKSRLEKIYESRHASDKSNGTEALDTKADNENVANEIDQPLFEGIPWGIKCSEMRSILWEKGYKLKDPRIIRNEILQVLLYGKMSVAGFESYKVLFSFSGDLLGYLSVPQNETRCELFKVECYFDSSIPFDDLKQSIIKTYELSENDAEISENSYIWDVNGVSIELSLKERYTRLIMNCGGSAINDNAENEKEAKDTSVNKDEQAASLPTTQLYHTMVDESGTFMKAVKLSQDEIASKGESILEWKAFNVAVAASLEDKVENNEKWECLRVGCFIDGEPEWGYMTGMKKNGQEDTLKAFIGGTKDEPCVYIYNERTGLNRIGMINGSVDWTVTRDQVYLGDLAAYVSGDNTGILYAAGSYGPDPVAISNEGYILWRSDIGLEDETIQSIELADNWVEVRYESGSMEYVEYNGKVMP